MKSIVASVRLSSFVLWHYLSITGHICEIQFLADEMGKCVREFGYIGPKGFQRCIKLNVSLDYNISYASVQHKLGISNGKKNIRVSHTDTGLLSIFFYLLK